MSRTAKLLITTLSGSAAAGITTLDQIPGLLAWYDASDLTTQLQASGGAAVTADSDPAGYVEDKSGNGYHISQATAGNKFTLKTNVLNGLSVWELDGADVLSVASVPISTFTVLAVFRATSGYLVYEHSPNAGNNEGAYLNAQNNAAISVNRAGLQSQWDISSTWGLGDTWRIVDQQFEGTHASHGLAINGTAQTLTPRDLSDNPGTSTATETLFVGARSGGAIGMVGQLAEIAIFSPYLSAANRSAARTIMNTKWAVY